MHKASAGPIRAKNCTRIGKTPSERPPCPSTDGGFMNRCPRYWPPVRGTLWHEDFTAEALPLRRGRSIANGRTEERDS